MWASKITVSEDTRKYKDLTPRERGKIRWERLKSSDLSNATTRKDIAVLGGYDQEDIKGSSWVNNLVNRGYLAEILDRKEGQVRYNHYALTGKEPFHRKTKRKRVVQTVTKPQVVKAVSTITKITIERGDLRITLETEAKQVADLITNILK